MSVVAKILVVLNLFLAIVFLGAAATFLGQQESWKIQFNKLKAQTDTEIANLQSSLKSVEDNFNNQKAIASTAVDKAENLKQQLQLKEQEYKDVATKHNALLGQFEKLSQTYKDAMATIKQLGDEKNTLINEKDQALAKARQATEAMNAAITEQKRLESVIADMKDQVAELGKRLNALAQAKEKVDMVVEAYKKKVGPLPEILAAPPIAARVSAVDNKMNIVILSVGRDDKVKEGYKFTIYRGDDYVGQVIIDKVEKDYCSGYSMKAVEKQPIQVGDRATTRF